MEVVVRIDVEQLPEGVFLATLEDIQGLVAQGRTVAEVLEIAGDVAKKILEDRADAAVAASLPGPRTKDHLDYSIVVGA